MKWCELRCVRCWDVGRVWQRTGKQRFHWELTNNGGAWIRVACRSHVCNKTFWTCCNSWNSSTLMWKYLLLIIGAQNTFGQRTLCLNYFSVDVTDVEALSKFRCARLCTAKMHSCHSCCAWKRWNAQEMLLYWLGVWFGHRAMTELGWSEGHVAISMYKNNYSLFLYIKKLFTNANL